MIPSPHIFFQKRQARESRWQGRWKNWLHMVMVELHPVTSGCGPCINHMFPLESRICKMEHAAFPVDAVYTWVDGNDPAHQAKRNAFLSNQHAVHKNGLEDARFRNNEELLFSLRALEACAPWLRSIILVTDNQKPGWLKDSHPKIRIVDHKEFIPERFLPTFNSHVIEAYLHKIPGLSEHYIYFNDDVFLARPCHRHEFFTPNGLPFAYVDWRKRRLYGYHYTKTPHATSYFNTLKILKSRNVPTNPKFITAHGPYPQRKSNVEMAFSFYEDIITSFSANKFRTTEEIAVYSHGVPLWIYHKKKMVPCDERYYYVQTKRRDRIAYYKAILQSKADHYAPLFFCINDVGDQRQGMWRDDLHILLRTYFPQPCSFEQ